MSRYRPPATPRSLYITAEGAKRLDDELRYLWKIKRPEVTQAVSEAAAMGDRSENAEYIYGKKQLREIDRRVRYLSKRLEALTVVDRIPDNHNRVFFGAWVDIEDDEGATHSYRIVGPDEIDLAKGHISMDSPLGRALLKKNLDDEIDVTTPKGIQNYLIVAIRYE